MTNLTHSYVFTSNYCFGNGMDNICLSAYLFSSTLHYNFNAIEMLQFIAKDFLFKIYIWFSNIGIFVVCSSVVMEVGGVSFLLLDESIFEPLYHKILL